MQKLEALRLVRAYLRQFVEDGEISEAGIDEKYLDRLQSSTQEVDVPLFRSQRQAAYWLSQSFSIDILCQIKQSLGKTLIRNLSRNIAPIIASYL